jgi:hypothetical protein
MLISTNWTFFSQLKIILIPDQECFPSVVGYIKQSLELRNKVHIGQCITLTINI